MWREGGPTMPGPRGHVAGQYALLTVKTTKAIGPKGLLDGVNQQKQ